MFVLERLVSILAPHHCLSCGAEGGLLCSWCQASVILPIPSRCYNCKTATTDFEPCERCKRKSRLRHVWVVTDYDGIPKQLIHSFKFERAQSAAATIGSFMTEALPYLPRETLLVPVPMATTRLRARGYDHTLLLAKAISRQTGLSYQAMVGRLGQSRQVGAKRELRLHQLEQAFFVKNPLAVKNADIILIDDIITTGGTLESLAKVLKRAGAKSVSALVFAQKT